MLKGAGMEGLEEWGSSGLGGGPRSPRDITYGTGLERSVTLQLDRRERLLLRRSLRLRCLGHLGESARVEYARALGRAPHAVSASRR